MAEKISLNAGTQKPLRFYADVLLRALLLLVIVNILFAFFKPVPKLARLSAYNSLFPGRLRLPYGENPERDYNTSLSSLEAMFAAHEISAEIRGDLGSPPQSGTPSHGTGLNDFSGHET